jgi:hypothetical protein
MYLRDGQAGSVTITIADKSGQAVRTLRQRGEAGLNRFVWNLRRDIPGQRPQASQAVPAGAGESPATGRGGGAQGPAVSPGDYAVKVRVGDRELTGQVTVQLDPNVQVAAADLEAQLGASVAAMALQARVTAVVERVDSLMAQLTTIDTQIARQSPPPAYRALVTKALAALKAFRDEELARPIQGLGYRQYPRLREDVQSLVGYFGRGFRSPNEGELERMKDLTDAVGKAEAKLNGLIAADVAAINNAMKGVPRVVVDSIK